MLKKYPFLLSIAFVLMAMSTLPAKANILASATATVNCQGYNLTVNATDLTVGTTYTIDFSFTLTCGSAPPRTIPGSITFPAAAATESVAAQPLDIGMRAGDHRDGGRSIRLLLIRHGRNSTLHVPFPQWSYTSRQSCFCFELFNRMHHWNANSGRNVHRYV